MGIFGFLDEGPMTLPRAGNGIDAGHRQNMVAQKVNDFAGSGVEAHHPFEDESK
jgi:hypothetical protein